MLQLGLLRVITLIWKPSLMSQEGDGMVIWPLNALEDGFQIWTFLIKLQVWLWNSGAAESSYALGLASIYTCEWLGLRKLIKKSMNWWRDIWFLWHIFSNLFHANLLQIMSNYQDSFQIWSCTKYWVYSMHKKI